MYHQCLFSLRQVFRENGDSGQNRIAKTPSTQILKHKLSDFSSKWNNTTVWTHETTAAITNLHKHVSAGCLSEIPPGNGTNRNERFHRFIRSFFNKSKIGITLAYALMSVLIHAHNSKVCVKGKHNHFQNRPMGVVSKVSPVEEGADHWEIDVSDRQLDMELVVSAYSKCVCKMNRLCKR